MMKAGNYRELPESGTERELCENSRIEISEEQIFDVGASARELSPTARTYMSVRAGQCEDQGKAPEKPVGKRIWSD